MSVTFSVPEEYGYVLAGLIGVCFHCTLQGGFVGRYKAMSVKWIEDNLRDENQRFKKKYGYDIPKGAYPDMTDGPHAQKLTYEEWLDYACAQRAHQNYVEGLAQVLFLGVVSGLGYPRATAGALVAYIVGRQLYCMGYRNNGPKGRLNGMPFQIPALLAMLGMACHTAFTMTPLA